MSNNKMPKYKSTVRLAPRNCLEDEDERPSRHERCPSGTKGRPSCHRPTVMAHQVAAEGRVQCSDPSCLRMFTTMKHMKRHLKDRHHMAYDRLQRCWKLDSTRNVTERKRGMADERYAQCRGLTARTAHRNTGLRADNDAPCPRVPRHPSTHSTKYGNQTCLSPVVAATPKPDIFVIHGDDGTITISDEGILRDETVSTMIKVVQENPEHNIPQNIRMFIRKLPVGTILNAVHQRDLVVGFRLLRAGLTTKLKPTATMTPLQNMLLPNPVTTQEGASPEALVPPLTPQGAWVEPGQRKDVSTSPDGNASLPSDEACEKVGSAGEPSADTNGHSNTVEQPSLPSDEACEASVSGEHLESSFNISLPSLPSVEACGGDTMSQLITPSLTPLGAWDARRDQDDQSSTSTEDFEIIDMPALDDMDVE